VSKSGRVLAFSVCVCVHACIKHNLMVHGIDQQYDKCVQPSVVD